MVSCDKSGVALSYLLAFLNLVGALVNLLFHRGLLKGGNWGLGDLCWRGLWLGALGKG